MASAGSDAQGIQTRAELQPDGTWLLNGSKHFIIDAQISDFFIVSAKTADKEISLFLVDKGASGFTVGKDQKMMGLPGTSHNEL
jgi:acyl-CoA dehydrogenase